MIVKLLRRESTRNLAIANRWLVSCAHKLKWPLEVTYGRSSEMLWFDTARMISYYRIPYL